jgi:hypothetical protein
MWSVCVVRALAIFLLNIMIHNFPMCSREKEKALELN